MPQFILTMFSTLVAPLLTAETAKFLILKIAEIVIKRYEIKAANTPDQNDDIQAKALREGYEFLKDKWS